jgi:hypothetical protein
MMQMVVAKIEEGLKSLPSRVSRLCEAHEFAMTARIIRKIDIDAPLTISFLFICCFVQAMKSIVGDDFVYSFFAVPSLSHFTLSSGRCWGSLVAQVVGHTSWEHLFGNISLLLLVGPTNERYVSLEAQEQMKLII